MRLISSVLEAYVTLPLRRFREGLDGDRVRFSILSPNTSISSDSLGGVEVDVSESVVSSLDVPRLSPLLRGVEDVVLFVGLSCGDRSAKGLMICFGSQGIGLFGSLEAQLGMLVCRCCVMLVEKELRRMNGFESSSVDMLTVL